METKKSSDGTKAAGTGSTADEFLRLAQRPTGNSRGWKFDRDEIHERLGARINARPEVDRREL